MIARCPYCSSIWVCWNWTFSSKEDLERLNPNLYIAGDEYGHECHSCGDDSGGAVFMTSMKITNGIPYKILMLRGWIKDNIFKYGSKRRKTHFEKLGVVHTQTKAEKKLMDDIWG